MCVEKQQEVTWAEQISRSLRACGPRDVKEGSQNLYPESMGMLVRYLRPLIKNHLLGR